MLRYSANLSMLFTELPFLQRPRAAAEAGFAGVEIQFPYAHSASEWRHALTDARMELVLFNLPAGDFMEGGRGLAGVPGQEAAFEAAVQVALDYARVLQPRCVNVLAGLAEGSDARDACRQTLASNLRLAAQAFADLGVKVLLEAVNTVDRPEYLIATTNQALDVIDLAGHHNLGLQYDVYHMQIMEGDLTRTLQRHLDRIGHVQFADVPGRHEPGTGGINFPFLFRELAALDYQGWVGAEYIPSTSTQASLGWLA